MEHLPTLMLRIFYIVSSVGVLLTGASNDVGFLENIVGESMCGKSESSFHKCSCEENDILGESLELIIREIIANLTVSRQSTSYYQRNKESASDDRTSAKVCGTVAILVLVTCGLLPVLSDITTWCCKRKGQYPSAKPYWYIRWRQKRDMRIKAALARFQGR